jgi:hypothetical protein
MQKQTDKPINVLLHSRCKRLFQKTVQTLVPQIDFLQICHSRFCAGQPVDLEPVWKRRLTGSSFLSESKVSGIRSFSGQIRSGKFFFIDNR